MITLTNLFLPSRHPPGERMAGVLARTALHAKAGSLLFSDATATYPIFAVPQDTMVWEVIVEVATLFNGTSPLCTIGDGTGVTGFFTSAEFIPATAGVRSSKKSAGIFAGGKHYTADDTIDAAWTIATGGPTTGLANFYVAYTPWWSRVGSKAY